MTTRGRRPARSVLVIAGACLVALTGFAILAGASAVDVAVRNAVLAVASPAVMAVAHVANGGGNWSILLPGTLVLFLVFERARTRWWIWVALMVLAPLSEQALKHLVGRPRPEATSFGFPSGHATAAAAFFGAVIYLAGSLQPTACRILRILAGAAIVLVGLARIMLRAHWPSDVLGGIALGLALVSLAAMATTVESASVPARLPDRG